MSDIPGSSASGTPSKQQQLSATSTSESGRKRQRISYDAKYEKTRPREKKQRTQIRVSAELLQRFEDIKHQMNLQTSEYVLLHLLDTYDVHNKRCVAAAAGEEVESTSSDSVEPRSSYIEETSEASSSEGAVVLPGVGNVHVFRLPEPVKQRRTSPRLVMSTPLKPVTSIPPAIRMHITSGPTSSISGASGSEREFPSSDFEDQGGDTGESGVRPSLDDAPPGTSQHAESSMETSLRSNMSGTSEMQETTLKSNRSGIWNTSVIETFNSLILAYAPKRISYRPPAYKARCQLAALDYQQNKDRPEATTKDGKPRLQRRRNKRTKRFDAYPVKEPKSYQFVEKVMAISVNERIDKPHLMREKMVLAESDPHRIMPMLSMETPESTQSIYEKKTSRL